MTLESGEANIHDAFVTQWIVGVRVHQLETHIFESLSPLLLGSLHSGESFEHGDINRGAVTVDPNLWKDHLVYEQYRFGCHCQLCGLEYLLDLVWRMVMQNSPQVVEFSS